MIVRTLLRAQAPKVASKRIFRIPARPIRTARRYSTANAPSMASSTPQSQAAMLATITTDLDKIAPRFDIQPEQITIIKTPTDFYETLKVGSSP
jgi:CDP-diacylglycerol--glycerol-3-phosphate 3-phosphatidyltransferase